MESSSSRQQLLDGIYGLGFEYEAKFGACGQCTLAALQSHFPFIDDSVFKAAHTLSGGGGRSGNGTCGALSGGMLAIGCRHGRARQDFERVRGTESARIAKKLYDRFVAEFGSPICNDILEKMMGRRFDHWNPEDREAFERLGGHRDKCPNVVGMVARWTAEVLLDEAREG